MEEKNHKSLIDIVLCEKEMVYPILFYIAGVIVGSFSFNLFNSNAVLSVLKSIYTANANNLFQIFISNFSVYISVFAVTVLLGLCLIGYPIINVIPFIMGVLLSIKITYFYTVFAVKGIGYSLLMIVPEGAAIVTTLLFTISLSSRLSKYIVSCTSNKGNIEEIKVKSLLKQYLIYASAVIVIVFINSLLIFLLTGIIKL